MTATLVYDADCGSCTRCAEFVVARSDCAVTPWQRLDLAAAGLTEEQVRSAAYWLPDEGPPLRGSRAVAAGLRSCGRGYRVLGRLVDFPPVRPLAALVYALVARFRYRLPGGGTTCRTP